MKSSLRLPPLLEKRRKEFNIPDGAFRKAAKFDRCFIWQIADYEGDFFKGTGIVMPETAKKRGLTQAPRGVLVSAGLQALDFLVTNGCPGLGAIIGFVRLSPWRMPVDIVDGKEVEVCVTRATDIVGDEDLAAMLATGTAEIVRGDDGRHRLNIGGVTYQPATPEASEDF